MQLPLDTKLVLPMLEHINSLILTSKQAYPGCCFITISSRLFMSPRDRDTIERKKDQNVSMNRTKIYDSLRILTFQNDFLFVSLKLGNAGVFKVLTTLEKNIMKLVMLNQSAAPLRD